METITFYSYKGGTGRTLLLANTARFLHACGKKVFMLDFDLEAPGLHNKFGLTIEDENTGLAKHIVDYQEGNLDLTRINPIEIESGSIFLLPAGKSPSAHYADLLARINWYRLFSEPSGSKTDDGELIPKGYYFFMKLKEYIQKKYPEIDYLLIDSRTGITHIGGIAINQFADKLVYLLINNYENYEGIDIILNEINPTVPDEKIYPVVSRVRNCNSIKDLENLLKTDKIDITFLLKNRNLSVLNSDSILESYERLFFDTDIILRNSQILQDYLFFFQKLFPVESKLYEDVISIIGNRNDFESLRTNTTRHFLKPRIQGNHRDGLFRIIGPVYYSENAISSFNSNINLVLRKLLGFANFSKIEDKEINWDLLGIEMQEKAFEFCNDIYYLTKTRSHLADILQVGFIETFTIVVDSSTELYSYLRKRINELNKTPKNQRLEKCIEVLLEEYPELEVGTMGDQAAATEAYRCLSKIPINKGKSTFYSRIRPKKDEDELIEWFIPKSETRVLVCDHVTIERLIDSEEFRKGDFQLACSPIQRIITDKRLTKDEDLEFGFAESIPAGYIYFKGDAKWRYYLNLSIYLSLWMNGDPKEEWESVENALSIYKISPFNYNEIKANIMWDLSLDQSLNWDTHYKQIEI